ncbi:hypothetical protein K7X08_026460 [Anisodus acutangulus]|uniref:Uncharacterized protein n=1 Tax=Anisodus acutangulus TaxID=402998 RepID=A0A9Q1R4Y4_9SOLA|nr:hypothetical protein K7X08_026460 [Anisodus acutangulus]
MMDYYYGRTVGSGFLLHEKDDNKVIHSKPSEFEEISSSRAFVKRILEESLIKLQEQNIEGDSFIRWELGACWIQHLQDLTKSEKDEKAHTTKTKNEIKVEGLGIHLKSLKNGKQNELQSESFKYVADSVDGRSEKAVLPSGDSQRETDANQNKLITEVTVV